MKNFLAVAFWFLLMAAVVAVILSFCDVAHAQPSGFIYGRLICAANVNAELARRGIRGTNSRFAKSFLRWGRSSRPVPGAVAIYGRRGGGHVAIVEAVDRRGIWVLNPGRRGWRIVLMRRPALSYRVP